VSGVTAENASSKSIGPRFSETSQDEFDNRRAKYAAPALDWRRDFTSDQGVRWLVRRQSFVTSARPKRLEANRGRNMIVTAYESTA
jgi:hypothetical protein